MYYVIVQEGNVRSLKTFPSKEAFQTTWRGLNYDERESIVVQGLGLELSTLLLTSMTAKERVMQALDTCAGIAAGTIPAQAIHPIHLGLVAAGHELQSFEYMIELEKAKDTIDNPEVVHVIDALLEVINPTCRP